jgi:hypothetical protein
MATDNNNNTCDDVTVEAEEVVDAAALLGLKEPSAAATLEARGVATGVTEIEIVVEEAVVTLAAVVVLTGTVVLDSL